MSRRKAHWHSSGRGLPSNRRPEHGRDSTMNNRELNTNALGRPPTPRTRTQPMRGRTPSRTPASWAPPPGRRRRLHRPRHRRCAPFPSSGARHGARRLRATTILPFEFEPATAAVRLDHYSFCWSPRCRAAGAATGIVGEPLLHGSPADRGEHLLRLYVVPSKAGPAAARQRAPGSRGGVAA